MYIHAYTPTYIHTYIHAYIHVCICICMHMFLILKFNPKMFLGIGLLFGIESILCIIYKKYSLLFVLIILGF